MSKEAPESRYDVLQRPRPSRQAVAAAASRFESGVTAVLEREFASLTERTRLMGNASAPVRKLLAADARAIASAKALRRLHQRAHDRRAEAIRKGSFEAPLTTFNFTADPGWQMLAPPYDLAWQAGGGFADRFDGKMWAIIGDGFTAAAVGVFLSVTRKSLVRFHPIAPYQYDWGNLAIKGPAASSGGVGVLAYHQNDAQPFFDRRGNLWWDVRCLPTARTVPGRATSPIGCGATSSST